ncbi:MAG: substrate-binding domain-containing protein [bacterium]
MENDVDTEYLYNLKMTNFPFVLLEDVGSIQTNIVTTDSLRAVKKAVKYLIENGHKKIVHFSGPPNSYYTKKRIAGFKHAFSESPLVFNKNMVVKIGASYHDGYYKTLEYFKILSKKDYPTAIVCFNDHQALAVMSALKELQIQVPQDISVIGYDDIFSANSYPVPLTTIRSSGHKIGVTAAKILIENIESKSLGQYEHIELKTELIVGKSSRKLN